MKKEKVRFAVVGYGFAGKRHCSHLLSIPRAELIAVADCDITRQNEARIALSCSVHSDYISMLEHHPEIEVVNICTPNGLHTEQAIKCLSRGCHVVIEKPMGLTVESCQRVMQCAIKMKRHVFCVLQNRYSPTVIWLREIIENHLLGKIQFVEINCFWNREPTYYLQSPWRGQLEMDGGPLFTQFSHFIDILRWLVGDVYNIHGIFARVKPENPTEFEDTGAINFQLKNGGIGSLNYSIATYRQNFESSITIIGEKGTVKIGGQYMNEVLHCDIQDYAFEPLPSCNKPNDYGFYQGSADNFRQMLENIILCLQGENCYISSGWEGLQGVNIIQKIYQHRAEFLRRWNLPPKVRKEITRHLAASI
ncbi:MAG: Gfo/Idh/MocA family oxidoreductase [Bacteroidia bacterium]|nr:Gfo/Idh/MocA family oxidoreductase [Bacteroidia bacterium]MDW8158774.1 Gfo/Idh/MocA family oxidoreductase [Bacteroidia bacterium]